MNRRQTQQRPKQRLYGPHFLREWRKYKQMTLEVAGEAVGLSHAQLGRIERRLQPYNQELLEALAELYGAEPASLIIRNPLKPDAMWSLWDEAKEADRIETEKYLEFRVRSRTGT